MTTYHLRTDGTKDGSWCEDVWIHDRVIWPNQPVFYPHQYCTECLQIWDQVHPTRPLLEILQPCRATVSVQSHVPANHCCKSAGV